MLVNQLIEADFAPPHPRTVQTCNNYATFVQEHVHIGIGSRRRARQTPDHQIDVVIAQSQCAPPRRLVSRDHEQ
jgi:hypothetical protein